MNEMVSVVRRKSHHVVVGAELSYLIFKRLGQIDELGTDADGRPEISG